MVVKNVQLHFILSLTSMQACDVLGGIRLSFHTWGKVGSFGIKAAAISRGSGSPLISFDKGQH